MSVEFVTRPTPNMDGYFVLMVCNKHISTIKCDNEISDYLQIDQYSFNEALKAYNGQYKNLWTNRVFNPTILYFTNEENANLFIKEYLEPNLIAKELLR